MIDNIMPVLSSSLCDMYTLREQCLILLNIRVSLLGVQCLGSLSLLKNNSHDTFRSTWTKTCKSLAPLTFQFGENQVGKVF
jgi:hypothetical protein